MGREPPRQFQHQWMRTGLRMPETGTMGQDKSPGGVQRRQEAVGHPFQAKPRQSHPDAPGGFRAPLTPTGFPSGARTIEFMVLEHGFGAARLNTGTMTDLPTLAATLLANFRTIHFPRSEDRSTPSASSRPDWFTTAKARRAERLAVEAYRRQLRQRLHDGHHRFLDHLEPDPRVDGGSTSSWRMMVPYPCWTALPIRSAAQATP